MAKNKLSILQEELRARRRVLEEDLSDIQVGDEYDPNIYKESLLEMEFLNKVLDRIWELKHN